MSEQAIVRREALEEIRKLGINPYPSETFEVTNYSTDIKANYKHDEDESKRNFQDISIAGRMMTRRIMGKAAFAEIQDAEGRIQVYINRDMVCEGEDKTLYNTVFKKLLDIGDFIGITGKVFMTKTGELTVKATSLKLLCKSLKPLPIVKTDADGNVHDLSLIHI